MNNYHLIVSILVVHVLAWFTPGPQIALIIRNSLLYSRRTGVFTATGFAIGNFLHTLYSVAGIALLVSQIPMAYNFIKFLGVGYLTYLGIKTFFMKVHVQSVGNQQEGHDISPFSAFKLGFVTNILNPKASLFFASIYSSVMAAGIAPWALGFLMVAMPLNSFVMASLWSLFFTQKWMRAFYAQYQSIFNKFLGGSLILFALIVAFSQR